MRATLLSLVLASVAVAQDAPKRVVLELESGVVFSPDGTRTEVEKGGCYMDARTCVAVGKEVASLRAENASLRESVGVPVALVAVGMVLAAGVGFGVAKLAR